MSKEKCNEIKQHETSFCGDTDARGAMLKLSKLVDMDFYIGKPAADKIREALSVVEAKAEAKAKAPAKDK